MASDVAITSGGFHRSPTLRPELGAISVGSYEMLARDCSMLIKGTSLDHTYSSATKHRLDHAQEELESGLMLSLRRPESNRSSTFALSASRELGAGCPSVCESRQADLGMSSSGLRPAQHQKLLFVSYYKSCEDSGGGQREGQSARYGGLSPGPDQVSCVPLISGLQATADPQKHLHHRSYRPWKVDPRRSATTADGHSARLVQPAIPRQAQSRKRAGYHRQGADGIAHTHAYGRGAVSDQFD